MNIYTPFYTVSFRNEKGEVTKKYDVPSRKLEPRDYETIQDLFEEMDKKSLCFSTEEEFMQFFFKNEDDHDSECAEEAWRFYIARRLVERIRVQSYGLDLLYKVIGGSNIKMKTIIEGNQSNIHIDGDKNTVSDSQNNSENSIFKWLRKIIAWIKK